MTFGQRFALSLAALAFVVACLFPPWLYTFQTRGVSRVSRPAGYSFLFSPPPPERTAVWFGVSLDASRLVIELVAIAALGFVGFASLGHKKLRGAQSLPVMSAHIERPDGSHAMPTVASQSPDERSAPHQDSADDWAELSFSATLPVAREARLLYPGPLLRFAACLIDAVFLLIVLAFLIPAANGLIGTAGHAAVNWVLAIVVAWLYFAACECSVSQSTIGKFVFRYKVIDDTVGDRIGFGRASVRYFGMLVTPILGLLVAFGTQRKQTLYDIWSGTCVVREKALERFKRQPSQHSSSGVGA